MEIVSNTDNVVYIDEYPELKKRVWLRRLQQSRDVGEVALLRNVLVFPTMEEHSTPSTD